MSNFDNLNRSLAVMACATGILFAASGAAETNDRAVAAKTLAQTVCAQCHGPDRKVEGSVVPAIAGQQQVYLEVQLKGFRNKRQRDPDASHYMWGISSAWLMDDLTVAEISRYYAAQPLVAEKAGSTAQVSEGKKLYETAGASASFPACATCHGASAEGMTVFPRLAGQRADYLLRQMHMQRVGLTESPLHLSALGQLSDAQIDSIARYLSSK